MPYKRQAAHAGHVEVGDNDIDFMFVGLLQGVDTVGCLDDVKSLAGERRSS